MMARRLSAYTGPGTAGTADEAAIREHRQRDMKRSSTRTNGRRVPGRRYRELQGSRPSCEAGESAERADVAAAYRDIESTPGGELRPSRETTGFTGVGHDE